MGKYYCDYCDVYLTHDSPAVRKQHNDGNRHKQSVCEYYKEFVGKRTQKEIDTIVANFEHRVTIGAIIPTFGFAEAPVKVKPADGQVQNTEGAGMAENTGDTGEANAGTQVPSAAGALGTVPQNGASSATDASAIDTATVGASVAEAPAAAVPVVTSSAVAVSVEVPAVGVPAVEASVVDAVAVHAVEGETPSRVSAVDEGAVRPNLAAMPVQQLDAATAFAAETPNAAPQPVVKSVPENVDASDTNAQ